MFRYIWISETINVIMDIKTLAIWGVLVIISWKIQITEVRISGFKLYGIVTALWKELELCTHFILKLLSCNYVAVVATIQSSGREWHPRNE